MCLPHCSLISSGDNATYIRMVHKAHFIQAFTFLQETIISHLQKRYDELQVYTYVGDILIALNPFQNLSIYSPQVGYRLLAQNCFVISHTILDNMNMCCLSWCMYNICVCSQFSKLYHGVKRADNPPHIFATADAAYQGMVTFCKDQVRCRKVITVVELSCPILQPLSVIN